MNTNDFLNLLEEAPKEATERKAQLDAEDKAIGDAAVMAIREQLIADLSNPHIAASAEGIRAAVALAYNKIEGWNLRRGIKSSDGSQAS